MSAADPWQNVKVRSSIVVRIKEALFELPLRNVPHFVEEAVKEKLSRKSEVQPNGATGSDRDERTHG